MSEVRAAILATGAKRADGKAIPDRAPDGWVHLSVALAKFAHALLGEGGEVWQDAFADIVQGAIAEVRGEPPESDLSVETGRYVCGQFAQYCIDETLITGFRRVGGGGDVLIMPGTWWDTEDLELRFRTWSIDPDDPLSEEIALPCWIWIEERSLRQVIARIRACKAGPLSTTIAITYEGEWCGLAETLALLDFVPPGDRLGVLIGLCSDGGCQAVADAVARTMGGRVVERGNHWPVPQLLWSVIDPLDPRINIPASKIIATDGKREWTLTGVLFDLVMLRRTLRESPISLQANTSDKIGAMSLEAWAADAASRGVAIRDARADAKAHMGSAAPNPDRCREALKQALDKMGKPVVRGRPPGSRSFAK